MADAKWCSGCKTKHPLDAFGRDASRADGLDATCRAFRNRRSRSRHQPRPALRHGPLPNPPRDGDRKQARQRVNVLVRTGRLAHPNTLPCADCGHAWEQGERRHEYDHHLGYAAENHLAVEAVCTICHRRRCDDRGELHQQRDQRGRFVSREEVVANG
jgi:hypothetical protein